MKLLLTQWNIITDSQVYFLALLMRPQTIVSLCAVPQVLLLAMLIYIGKPQPTQKMDIHIGVIVLDCSMMSPGWLAGCLSYIALLAITCFWLTFHVRTLPEDSDEHRFIRFSILFHFLVLIAFVPAYSSTTGKFSLMVQTFAVMAMAYGFLGCLFFPKCFFILFKKSWK